MSTGFTQQDSEHLELAIIDLVEDIRVKVLQDGYTSRHIKIVIPENLRPALDKFSLAPYAGFTYSIEYQADPRYGDDIFVYPVMDKDKEETLREAILRLWRRVFGRWL